MKKVLQTDGQTERSVLRAACSQLKMGSVMSASHSKNHVHNLRLLAVFFYSYPHRIYFTETGHYVGILNSASMKQLMNIGNKLYRYATNCN